MNLFIILSLFTFSLPALAQKDSLVEIKDLTIDSMGDLKWKTWFHSSISFQVEQFKNDKWLVIYNNEGRSICTLVPSKSPGKFFFKDSLRVRFHKGLNKYRIRVTDPSKFISPEVHLTSLVANDTTAVWLVHNEIVLDNKENYEIIDATGTTLLKGEANRINIVTLPKGTYFLYTKRYTKAFSK